MSNNTEKNSTTENSNKRNKFTKKISQIFVNIFSSRIFIAIIFLITGSMITNSCNKATHKYYYHHSNDDIFEDDDIFVEFENFNKKFYKAMQRHENLMKKAFEDNKNLNENTKISASITQNQDENFYYYELNYNGIKPEDLNILIEKGFVVFTSHKTDIKKVKEDDNSINSESSSNFYYAINLPKYDEKIPAEIIKNNNKAIVKLKKITETKLNKDSIKNLKTAK